MALKPLGGAEAGLSDLLEHQEPSWRVVVTKVGRGEEGSGRVRRAEKAEVVQHAPVCGNAERALIRSSAGGAREGSRGM